MATEHGEQNEDEIENIENMKIVKIKIKAQEFLAEVVDS